LYKYTHIINSISNW